jgi:transcriptional regulator of NAD metabolism
VSAAVAEADARTRQTLDRLGIVGERVHDHPSAVAAIFRLLRRHRHARRR